MEAGFPDAIERMAEAYLGDELGLEKDEKTALRLFKRGARLGNSEAQYNVGMAYANGWYGLVKDEKKAVRWLKKSVNGENPWACLQMGLYYYYVIKTNTGCKKAFDLFKKACALGGASARKHRDLLPRGQRNEEEREGGGEVFQDRSRKIPFRRCL